MAIKTRNNELKKSPFGVAEWCAHSVNFVVGCSNGCKYCYSLGSLIIHKRKTPENRNQEEINEKIVNQKRVKLEGRIMCPSTHDITKNNLDSYMILLNNLLSVGNSLLIVSKPDPYVIKRLCTKFAAYKKQILFRFTIGTNQQKTLKFWEPDAPTYKQRFESLKFAYENGFETSISCEPCLHKNVKPMIDELMPYVTDAIWIGKPNMFMQRLSLNGFKDANTKAMARKLLADLNDEWAQELYSNYKDNKKIKWKDSLKKVLYIPPPCQSGLDI